MTANQGVTTHAALMRYEPAPADIPAELALAAIYTREVRAGIERIWENVLDWQHLPALHDISFNHVALIEIGSWGWRVTERTDLSGCELTVQLIPDHRPSESMICFVVFGSR
jgi:hypothetical protein